MPLVTCRCGEKLKVIPDGPDRIECPKVRGEDPAAPAAPARGGNW